MSQNKLSKEQVDVEMAAHGGTIVEIRKEGGKWQVVADGKLNRRITPTRRCRSPALPPVTTA